MLWLSSGGKRTLQAPARTCTSGTGLVRTLTWSGVMGMDLVGGSMRSIMDMHQGEVFFAGSDVGWVVVSPGHSSSSSRSPVPLPPIT